MLRGPFLSMAHGAKLCGGAGHGVFATSFVVRSDSAWWLRSMATFNSAVA